MDVYEKAKIEWFIDFCNLKLNELSFTRLNTLATDTQTIIQGMAPYLFNGPYQECMPDGRWKFGTSWNRSNYYEKLKACQDCLKACLIRGMKEINDTKKWLPVPEATNWICYGEIEAKMIVRLETPLIEPELKPKGDGLLSRLPENKISQAPINMAFKAKSDEDTLLIYFFQSLSILNVGSILQCLECDKYFLHTSKRKKIYCSHKCAARNTSRKRREKLKKDPFAKEKENRKGAKRARKSYEKKIIAKFKAKNPKAKIQAGRRPWKHKDKIED